MYGNYMNPYSNQKNYYSYFPTNEQQNRNNMIQPMPMQNTNIGLLGKSVESLDVVKAMDIPLDGSISYFPLTDGSAIVSKQLQMDGTSKIVIYKPVKEEQKQQPIYATMEDLEEIKSLKDDFESLKKEFEKFKTQTKGDKK